MKKVLSLLIALLLCLFVFAGCANPNANDNKDQNTDTEQQNEGMNISGKDEYTEFSGIFLSIESVESSTDARGDEYHIYTLRWHNQSNKDFEYDASHTIEYRNGDTWVDKTVARIDWVLDVYTVHPNETSDIVATTRGFDTTALGIYRIRYDFKVDGKTYNSWVIFEIREMDDAEVPEVLIKIEKWNGDKFEGIVANPLFSYLEVGDKVSVICENETIASEAQYSIGTLVVVRFGRFDANVQPNILYAEAVENGEPDVPIDSNNSQSGDNNNYVTIETAVSDVMPPYAISCKIPTEHSTDNTTIPIILSFGLVEGCDADTDNYSEIVLSAENDEGQTIIIKRINISEILKSEYFVESVWDDNREWIIGFNYTHRESFALPLSLFSGTSGQIHIGLYECSSTDLETMKLGSGAYIVLSYTRNESSISISAEAIR